MECCCVVPDCLLRVSLHLVVTQTSQRLYSAVRLNVLTEELRIALAQPKTRFGNAVVPNHLGLLHKFLNVHPECEVVCEISQDREQDCQSGEALLAIDDLCSG